MSDARAVGWVQACENMTRMGAGFVLTELMLPRDGYEDVLVLGRRISTGTGAQRKYSTVLKATIAAGDLDTHTPSHCFWASIKIKESLY